VRAQDVEKDAAREALLGLLRFPARVVNDDAHGKLWERREPHRLQRELHAHSDVLVEVRVKQAPGDKIELVGTQQRERVGLVALQFSCIREMGRPARRRERVFHRTRRST
jgi:hypothetical protein